MLGPLQFLILDPEGITPPPGPPPPLAVPAGVYSHITFGQLKSELSLRLYDSPQIFWTNTEIGLYITEALRMFGLCSGFWRVRGTFPTSQSMVFYDINQILSTGTLFPLQPTVTDQQIIQMIQYHLLESATSQTAWTGTEQFTYQDIVNAVQNRLNQFLSETGCVVNRAAWAVISPPNGRQPLEQYVIDVRRAAWLGVDTQPYYQTLWREDERSLTAADQTWSVNTGTPEAYSIMGPPPLQMQLSPIPISSGIVELLTVNSTTINPAVAPTVLGIPDHLSPAIKWGALADLFGKDGIARDPVRAQYCDQRYQMMVALARLLPVVVHAEVNGNPLIPCTLQELDAASPTWQNITGTPTDLCLAAPNLAALNPVPDGVYSVTMDVVRQPPIPVSDTDFVQIGREQIDMIVDYGENLALLKVYGMEWHATERALQDFILQALTYNQRLSAAARSAFSASMQSQRQKTEIPRRVQSPVGLGSLINAGS